MFWDNNNIACASSYATLFQRLFKAYLLPHSSGGWDITTHMSESLLFSTYALGEHIFREDDSVTTSTVTPTASGWFFIHLLSSYNPGSLQVCLGLPYVFCLLK